MNRSSSRQLAIRSVSILALVTSLGVLAACVDNFPFGGSEPKPKVQADAALDGPDEAETVLITPLLSKPDQAPALAAEERQEGLSGEAIPAQSAGKPVVLFPPTNLLAQRPAASVSTPVTEEAANPDTQTRSLALSASENKPGSSSRPLPDAAPEDSDEAMEEEEVDPATYRMDGPHPGPRKPDWAPTASDLDPTIPRLPLPKKPDHGGLPSLTAAPEEAPQPAPNKEEAGSEQAASEEDIAEEDVEVANLQDLRAAIQRARQNVNENNARTQAEPEAAGEREQGEAPQVSDVDVFEEPPHAPEEIVLPPEDGLTLGERTAPLAFGDWRDADFPEEEKRLRSHLLQAMIDGESDATDVLDLVNLHLAFRLPQEALSLLEELPEDLSEEEELRAASLTDVAHLQRGETPDQGFRIINNEEFSDWPDWAAWTALHKAREKLWEEAAVQAVASLEHIQSYPLPLKRELLTLFTEALIKGGDETAFEKVAVTIPLLESFAVRPDERVSLAYLMGLSAERLGESEAAARAYAEASKGEGYFAQKARIALVDFGLATRRMTPDEAEALLSDAHDLWRGDELEIELLKRLALLRDQLQDKSGAALALAHLIKGFPDDPVAEQSKQRLLPLLDELYLAEDRSENFSLGDWMTMHRALEHALGASSIFLPYREAHAKVMEEVGLTAEAAREYEKLADLQEGEEGFRHALQEARNLIKGYAYDKAVMRLSRMQDATPAHLEEDYNRTWLRLLNEIEKSADHLAYLNDEDHSLEGLLLRGQLYWKDRDWPKAKETYALLSEKHPQDFTTLELLRFMLAAYRAGDADTFMAAAQDHAGMIENDLWREIAENLISDPPEISPLGSEEARRIIEAAEDVGDLISRAFNS